MNDQKPENANEAASAQSALNVGLGLLTRIREWAEWSKSQSEDGLANLLFDAANEIENLRACLTSVQDSNTRMQEMINKIIAPPNVK